MKCAPKAEPPGVLRVEVAMFCRRGCRMKSNGTRYSPAFKFRGERVLVSGGGHL